MNDDSWNKAYSNVLMNKKPKFKIGDKVVIKALFEAGFKDIYIIENIRLDLREDLFIYNILMINRSYDKLGDWLYESQIEEASEIMRTLYE